MKIRWRELTLAIGVGIFAFAFSVANAQTNSFNVSSRPFGIRTIAPKDPPRRVSKDLGPASGLAWQVPHNGNPGKLWIAFEEAKKLANFNPADSKTIVFAKDSETQFVPVLLAFDYRTLPGSDPADTATRLWSINGNRMAINRGIVTDMSPPDSGGFPGFDPSGVKDIKDDLERSRITGFALDPLRYPAHANYYVACRAGGLCSSIEVRQRDDNQIIAQLYPGCEPLDIAIDPTGRTLWILASQGPTSPRVLLERRLEDSTAQERFRSAGGPTRKIREPQIRGNAVAITATNNSVWVLSNIGVTENGETSIHSYVSEFAIGSGP